MIKSDEIRDQHAGFGCASHGTLTVKLCCSLVADKIVTNAEHKIGNYQTGRILGGLRERCALLRDRERATEVGEPQQEPIQPEKKLQSVPTVPERLLKSEYTLNRGANQIAVSRGIHRRQCEGFLKDHLLPGATGGIVQAGKRPFTPPVALLEQRQIR